MLKCKTKKKYPRYALANKMCPCGAKLMIPSWKFCTKCRK